MQGAKESRLDSAHLLFIFSSFRGEGAATIEDM